MEIEPTEEQSAVAFEIEARIVGHVRVMRTTWIDLARDLYLFTQDKMWKHLGYRTFDAWLANPEVEMSRRQAFALLEVWRGAVVEHGIQPEQLVDVPMSHLVDTLPALRRGLVNIEQAMSDSKTLHRDDLRQRYKEMVRGSDPLDADAEPEWAKCPSCGSLIKSRRS